MKEGLVMMSDEKIENSDQLEFAVFGIENVAAKLGVGAEKVYDAFTAKSNILNGYIVPEYEVLHTQSRQYIVDDLLDVMKEERGGSMIVYHGSYLYKKHFLCCILKGVNRYDSKSHFASKKMQSCHRMLCKKASSFTGCGIGVLLSLRSLSVDARRRV